MQVAQPGDERSTNSWSHLQVMPSAESQKPGMRVCIANRKVFARLESFCAYLRNWPYNEP